MSAEGTITAVSRNGAYTFTKPNRDEIVLVAGIGVEGDVHAGVRVRHRSRVAADPCQPNLRQVHLIQAELFEEVAGEGYDVPPGGLGENVTTSGIDLLALPRGTILRFGHPGAEGGHPGGEGDLGAEGGELGAEGGDPGAEGGDPGAEGGDPGSEGGDLGGEGGHPGGEGGHPGGDPRGVAAVAEGGAPPRAGGGPLPGGAAGRPGGAAGRPGGAAGRPGGTAGGHSAALRGVTDRHPVAEVLAAARAAALDEATVRAVEAVEAAAERDVAGGDGRPAIVVAGLRNPCAQINGFRAGLLKEVLGRDEEGNLVRKAGVMGVVLRGGPIRPGDPIVVELPPGPHGPLERV